MKTKRDYSISVLIIIFGLVFFLPAVFSDSFLQHTGSKILVTVAILFVFLGLLKIEKIEINDGSLTKTNFLFKRTIKLNSIKEYKVKAYNMNFYSQHNIASILKIFKHGQRYSIFRVLTIYPEGKWRLKIDERTMSTTDFKKVLKEVKKVKRGKKAHSNS